MDDEPFGEDFDGVEDLSFELSTVGGQLAVAQAVARRLTTPNGALWYDKHYGYDLHQFMNAAVHQSASEIKTRCIAEARKDQRVLNATARVVIAGPGITVTIGLETAAGPFSFTLRLGGLSSAAQLTVFT